MKRSIALLLILGLTPYQDLANEIRVWNRSDGTIVRLNSIKAITTSSIGEDYGRFLKWNYSVERTSTTTSWTVVGDCKSFSADWDDDGEGFIDLRRPNDNSSKEARSVLDDFCPQMNRLIDEAKGEGIKEVAPKQPIKESRSQKRNDELNKTSTKKSLPRNDLFEKCKDAADFEGCIDVFTKKRSQDSKTKKIVPSSIKREPTQRITPTINESKSTKSNQTPVRLQPSGNKLPKSLTPLQQACIDASKSGFRGAYNQRLKFKCKKVLKSIPGYY